MKVSYIYHYLVMRVGGLNDQKRKIIECLGNFKEKNYKKLFLKDGHYSALVKCVGSSRQ